MKCGKRLSVLQRQEIGLSVHKGPCKASLARRYKCTRSVVDRWLEEGLKKDPDYSDKRGRGRKTKYSSEQASCIRRWAKSGLSTRSIASKTPHRHHAHISKSNAHRILIGGKHPLEYCVVRRSATLRAKNKHARVQFCQDKPRPHVSTWVFADAKDLYVYNYGKGGCEWKWQDIDAKAEPQGTNPWVFRFYGAVALGHKTPSLFFVPPSPQPGTKQRISNEKFDSKCFQDFLKWLQPEVQSWFPSGPHNKKHPKLVLDHASQHTSTSSQAYMKLHGVELLEGYPAQCWDINIIENIWAALDQNLKGKKGNSGEVWRRHIIKAWEGISQHLIDRRVKSVNKRLAKIGEKEGAWLSNADLKALSS